MRYRLFKLCMWLLGYGTVAWDVEIKKGGISFNKVNSLITNCDAR